MEAAVVVNGTDSIEEKHTDKTTVETESKAEQEKAPEPDKPSNSTTHDATASEDSLTSSSEDEDETPSAKPEDASNEEQSSPALPTPIITIDGAELRLDDNTPKVDGDSKANGDGEGEKATLAPQVRRRRSEFCYVAV